MSGPTPAAMARLVEGLREELEVLRPLARAALAWRDAEDNDDPRVSALLDVIDALPEDLKARLREGA